MLFRSLQSTALGKDHRLRFAWRIDVIATGWVPRQPPLLDFPANKKMSMCHRDRYDRAKLVIQVARRAAIEQQILLYFWLMQRRVLQLGMDQEIA